MSVLNVCFSILSFMATVTHSAPLRGVSALVDDQQFQDLVQSSHILIQKILHSIPGVHNSSVHIKSLQLGSKENTKLDIMVSDIGIPPAPVVSVVSENCTVETSLTQIYKGLQLHRELLNAVLPKLSNNDKATELTFDIRDLLLQIDKMLKFVQETPIQPKPEPVALSLPGEFEIQVAAHQTLVQLETFANDTVHSLRSMETSEEEEQES